MSYNKNKNYQEEIDKAVQKGDYASASVLEKERNEKIDAEGLSYQKTNNYAMPNGVSGSSWNAAHETYKPSDNVSSLDEKTNNALTNVSNIASQQIISDSALKGMNAQFQTPSAVTQADAWLSQQLQQIQSGKTSYSDDVRNMMDKIMNREKFSYDVDKDPLFQQALASAMNSGKTAMQDTIGQASALTGGYGSSYATSAGNQAYNSFIEDAYDNLPQYYQMALEAYQMEGDEMYRQYGMLSEQDDKEYNRNLQAYDATYQHRNRMYDESYQLHRDSVNDSFNLANLQINEHGQRMSDAYNLYNATSNQADKMYEREYTTWADKINMLYKDMEMLNTDWWNQTNFDEGVRQYEKNFDENVRQFNENQAFQAEWNQKQMDFEAEWNQKKMDFEASENAKNRAASRSGGGGNGGGSPKALLSGIPSAVTAFLEKATSDEQISDYLALQENNGVISPEQTEALMSLYALPSLMERDWEMTFDGGKNGGDGLDEDGRVKDPRTGKEYRLDELYKAILEENRNSGFPLGHQEISDYMMKLQRNLGITMY